MEQPKYLRDVDLIFMPGNMQIETRADLEKFVELPCLEVCQKLYDKNILTCWSSANKTATKMAYVLVRYESLSDENKKIADDLVAKGILSDNPKYYFDSGNKAPEYGRTLYIGFDTNPDMLVSDISSRLCEMASAFVPQDIKYNVYTPEYLLSKSPVLAQGKCFGFPSLKTTVCGGENEYSNNYKPEMEKVYKDLRMFLCGKQDTGLSEQDMRYIADKIGWIYNPTNGYLYKDQETLRRHEEYERIYKSVYKIKQGKQIVETLSVSDKIIPQHNRD